MSKATNRVFRRYLILTRRRFAPPPLASLVAVAVVEEIQAGDFRGRELDSGDYAAGVGLSAAIHSEEGKEQGQKTRISNIKLNCFD